MAWRAASNANCSRRLTKNGSDCSIRAAACNGTRAAKAVPISSLVAAFRTWSCTPFIRAVSCMASAIRALAVREPDAHALKERVVNGIGCRQLFERGLIEAQIPTEV